MHAMKMMRGLRDVHMREVQMVASAAVAEVFATVFVKDAGERDHVDLPTQDKRPLLTPKRGAMLPPPQHESRLLRHVMS